MFLIHLISLPASTAVTYLASVLDKVTKGYHFDNHPTALLSRLRKLGLVYFIFPFIFIFIFNLFFHFLFLEQLGLWLIGHTVTI